MLFRGPRRPEGRFLKDRTLKTGDAKKSRPEGDVMLIATRQVDVLTPTAPIYDAISMMSSHHFRRLPIASPGTRKLQGIVTAVDIVNFLGGGPYYNIIALKYRGNYFAGLNHPVEAISTSNVLKSTVYDSIDTVLKLMVEKNVGAIPLVDGEGRVSGIITEKDLMKSFSQKFTGAKVLDIMSKSPVTLLKEDTLETASKTMISRGIRRLPVVFDGIVLGMLTAMEILDFVASPRAFQQLKTGTAKDVLSTPVDMIMRRDFRAVRSDSEAGAAAAIMKESDVGAIPVVENGVLLGVVTERDFFKILR